MGTRVMTSAVVDGHGLWNQDTKAGIDLPAPRRRAPPRVTGVEPDRVTAGTSRKSSSPLSSVKKTLPWSQKIGFSAAPHPVVSVMSGMARHSRALQRPAT
jgi:hypothetical protein